MLRELAVVLLWAAALFRAVRSVQLRHSTPLHSITAALVAIALAGTVTLPVVADGINAVAGVPNFSEAMKNVAIVWAAVSNRIMFVSLTKPAGLTPPRATRQILVASAVSALSVGLFLKAGVTGEFNDFVRQTASLSWVSESRVVVTVYAGLVLSSITWLCLRHPRTSNKSSRGLLILGAGTAVMVGYCLLRLVFFAVARLGLVANQIFQIGSAAATVGLALIAVGTLWTPLREWVVTRREMLYLEPLWTAIIAHEPSVEISTSISGVAGRVEHRVVQIEDGMAMMASRQGESNALSDRTVREIAQWVKTPQTTSPPPVVELAPPPHLTHAQWIHTLATEFRRFHRHCAEAQ